MIKSIYDKALDILVDSVTDPQDEDDNCYVLNYKEINLIIDTVKEAKKQEKLLNLYKELLELNKTHTTFRVKRQLDIEKEIKELER